MTHTILGSATTGDFPDPVSTSSDDVATRAWEYGNHAVLRDALLGVARDKLSRLMQLQSGWDSHRAQPTTPIAAMAANGLLTELVADDGPTPQLAPFPDGGVQIEWLVGGTSLVVDVDADGDVLITADEPSGDELFSIEFPFWNPDPVGLDLCRRLLEKMSGMVERRLGA